MEKESIRKVLSRNVKNCRELKDWSATKLSIQAGLNSSTVRDLEKEKYNTTPLTLEKIAIVLGVTEAQLADGALKTDKSIINSAKPFTDPIALVISSNVKSYRKAQKLSQEKLSSKAGLYHTSVGLVERMRNMPTVETIEKIANALDITVSDILNRDTTSKK